LWEKVNTKIVAKAKEIKRERELNTASRQPELFLELT
jgi:hypothetical protein